MKHVMEKEGPISRLVLLAKEEESLKRSCSLVQECTSMSSSLAENVMDREKVSILLIFVKRAKEGKSLNRTKH